MSPLCAYSSAEKDMLFQNTQKNIYRKFTPEFKSKVVLELLETGKSVNEIASKYNLLPKSVTTWKKQFFENAPSAFEDSVSTKKYKDEIKEKEQKIEELEKTLGRTVMISLFALTKARLLCK